MKFAAGLFVLNLMKLTSQNPWPEQLELKQTKLVCSDLVAYVAKDGYKYVGLDMKGSVSYMSDYTDASALQKEVERQCK